MLEIFELCQSTNLKTKYSNFVVFTFFDFVNYILQYILGGGQGPTPPWFDPWSCVGDSESSSTRVIVLGYHVFHEPSKIQ
jgi:hypothetical protein